MKFLGQTHEEITKALTPITLKLTEDNESTETLEQVNRTDSGIKHLKLEHVLTPLYIKLKINHPMVQYRINH